MTAESKRHYGGGAKDYVSEQGSGLGRKTAESLLSAADVDALKPFCIVFKALFDALKGAAKNRPDLVDLLGYGVLLVKSIPDTGTASGLSSPEERSSGVRRRGGKRHAVGSWLRRHATARGPRAAPSLLVPGTKGCQPC